MDDGSRRQTTGSKSTSTHRVAKWVLWEGEEPSGSGSSTTLLARLYVAALLVSVKPSPGSGTAKPTSVTRSNRFCTSMHQTVGQMPPSMKPAAMQTILLQWNPDLKGQRLDPVLHALSRPALFVGLLPCW